MAETYSGLARHAEICGCPVCYIDEGSGRPLLFVHGLGGTMNNWAPNIAFFRKGFRVVALDLPGYGESGYVDEDYGLDFFARLILGLLEHLGLEKVTVIGHSLGGLITLHLALNHPEMVSEIVLVDSAGGHRFPLPLRWGVARLPEKWVKFVLYLNASYVLRLPYGYKLAGVYHVNRYTKALIDYQLALSERPDLDTYLEAYLRTTRTAFNVTYADRLGEVSVPALLVWGQKDGLLPLRVGRYMNRSIEGSYLVSVERAAHVVQLDQPEVFNAAVLRFLLGSREA